MSKKGFAAPSQRASQVVPVFIEKVECVGAAGRRVSRSSAGAWQGWGLSVIVETFLRWAETAKPAERARAASALGRAYCEGRLDGAEARAAEMAMMALLDDRSPQVRAALAEAVASSENVPRRLLLCLAADQPDIACYPILSSPRLGDADLVDLALEGSAMTRMLVAARPMLSRAVSAALAEIGETDVLLCLLQNCGASLAPAALVRLAERAGAVCEIRDALLDRQDLPAKARHILALRMAEALSRSSLIRESLGTGRLDRLAREATEAVAIDLAVAGSAEESTALLDHLLQSGGLTPAFLLQLVCQGRLDFFAAALARLSDQTEKRVRALLATGRPQALAALLVKIGLQAEQVPVLVQAVLIWRERSRSAYAIETGQFCALLIERCRDQSAGQAAAMLRLVERLMLRAERQKASAYAQSLLREAA